ncbi:restriction endonuclease subunit S [Streptomyces sp. NPDC088261]|uniref:restriction endonuclease subunit S n=1 Tax=Streptomyces sp. NPDC088261 TaxID=3365851 RepID=UPI0038003AD9
MDLPAGWAWARLGDLGVWYGGGTPAKNRPEFWMDGSTPWLSPKDMGPEVVSATQNHITEAAVAGSAVRIVPSGSVAIVVRSGILERIIPVSLVPFETTLNQDMKAVRAHEGILPRWIAWSLRAFERQILRESRKAGTTVASLATDALMDLRVPLAPIGEQYRIVDAIEDHLSRLQAATESMAGAKRRIKPFTTSVLDRTALGASLATCSEQDAVDDSQHLLAGLSSKRFDYAALPPLPKGWFWRRSADVCEFISSGSTPKAHLMHPGSGEVPFLKVYNITQDGRVDFTNKPTYIDRETHESQLKRSRVRPGDVLTNIVGPPLGKTAVVPEDHPEWNINQAIVAFRAGPEVQPEWLALVLRSPFVLSMLQKTAKATAGQFNVALSTCRELPLPVPPMDVQLALVAQSAELLEVSDRFATQVASVSLRAQNLRRAVLRRAFTGSLVPQDSADEPASALLDRIRAEREARGAKPKRAVRRPRKTAAPETLPSPPALSTHIPTTAVQQELPL